jgi:polyisoprenoid-binding protein YceI
MLLRAFLCLVILACGDLAVAAPARYALDPTGSEVRFSYVVGGVEAAGTMPVTAADIVLDFDNAAASGARVTLSAEGAQTGVALMTSALKGNDVLDTDRFPDIRFRSTGFTASPGGAVVRGDVTVRGVTRPLTLRATIFRPEGSAPGDRTRLTVRLTGAIDRHAFGASGYSGLVEPTVTLDIRARLLRSD